MNYKEVLMFLIVLVLLMVVGFFQSWTLALMIFNMCIISAIMSLGVNIQWGYAGLFNLGIMGFVALGGLAVVITSAPPISEAWSVGGLRVITSFIFAFITILSAIYSWKKIKLGKTRNIISLSQIASSENTKTVIAPTDVTGAIGSIQTFLETLKK